MSYVKELFSRLNETCYSLIEEAFGSAVSNRHYEVVIAHYLLKMLEKKDSDFDRIMRHFGVKVDNLKKDILRAVDRLQKGNSDNPRFSPDMYELIEKAWLLANIQYTAPAIRSSHILIALLSNASLKEVARGISEQFSIIQLDYLRQNLANIVGGSIEESPIKASVEQTVEQGHDQSTQSTTALDKYTIDLTEQARYGKLGPVTGRDREIRNMIDILTRRYKNNPILVGEAGVGKTAIVEGFACRVASGEVPTDLKGIAVRILDLGLLQAGASTKGEFEQRLKQVIKEVQSSLNGIILFIDEAHTLIGAGGQAGQNDAANLLKPALARGELRTIAATTWSEYKKFFEKDAALSRRFQPIKVNEPSELDTIAMVRGLVASLEKHHQVKILDEAVIEAVKLSSKYLTGQHQPDKAIGLLDTACSKVATALSVIPASLEFKCSRLDQIRLERDSLLKESATGIDHSQKINELSFTIDKESAELIELNNRWSKEQDLVDKVRFNANYLINTSGKPAHNDTAIKSLADLQQFKQQLLELQGDSPLMAPFVSAQGIAEIVSAWTGIPVGRMMADEIKTVINLDTLLGKDVIGQSHALEIIAQSIQQSRAGIEDPNRPIGVFLLVGPSGVGKTETAKALANLLFGSEQNLIKISMNEYQESHSVTKLKGSPPSYVGYGEGGVLTEAVRRQPYSVLLLDEIEKSDAAVRELFYQVFDCGTLEDGEGREINFKNTIILMTSNIGSEVTLKLCADPETRPEPEALTTILNSELLKVFKPEMLGRMTVIPYYSLTEEDIARVVELKLASIGKRLSNNHAAQLTYSNSVVAEIVKRCKEVQSGARSAEKILKNSFLPSISKKLLSSMADGQPIQRVHVEVQGSGFSYQFS